MTSVCDLPIEDLVAYLDGELRGGRKELVEAHLQACPVCRRRRARFEEVDRLLRESSPLADDPAGRAAIRGRVELAARSRGHTSLRRNLLVAVVLALAALLMIWPASSRADLGLRRFVSFADQQPRRIVPAHEEPAGTRVVDATAGQVEPTAAGQALVSGIEPLSLPHGLILVNQAASSPGRREALYRNETGLTVSLMQEPAGLRPRGQSVARGQPAMVEDTEALWLPGARSDVVAGVIWERAEVYFELLVLEAPPPGLSVADARQIVEGVIAAQKAAR